VEPKTAVGGGSHSAKPREMVLLSGLRGKTNSPTTVGSWTPRFGSARIGEKRHCKKTRAKKGIEKKAGHGS